MLVGVHKTKTAVLKAKRDTVCEDNDIKQKWKRSIHDDEFAEYREATVDELEEEEYDEAVEIIEDKINELAETEDELTRGREEAKVESGVTSGGRSKRFWHLFSRQEARCR